MFSIFNQGTLIQYLPHNFQPSPNRELCSQVANGTVVQALAHKNVGKPGPVQIGLSIQLPNDACSQDK